jgi:hypothetical protein
MQLVESSVSDYSLEELLDAWRSLKLSIDEREKTFEESLKEDKTAVGLLEGYIMDDLKAQKLSSVKLAGDDIPDYLQGTAYLSKRFGSKVEDPEAFFNYVIKTGKTELLFARAADKAVEEFVKEEKMPPPGIKVSTTQKLNFRKAN